MNNKKEDLFQYERALYNQGINYIGGIDEVGRGPLIGPVVAACVVLPKDFVLDGLTDSKKLSEKKRESFYDILMEKALGIGIGMVEPQIIDEINIYQASKLAMIKAYQDVKCEINHVLIDAMPLELEVPSTSIIKGDAKSISIAAASVIAKVTRDRLMQELDKQYPQYGFKRHKGYPTKAHLEALKEHGIIEGYRFTYGPVIEVIGEHLKEK